MSETKTLKAWAVVEKDGELIVCADGYLIGKTRDLTTSMRVSHSGERVVPVTITYEVTR